MSTKKTDYSKKTKPRDIRVYSKSDFKKIPPSDLEKLGYSRKSERYYPPKNYTGKIDKNGTISKDAQTKAVFGLNSKQRASAIKSGKRPVLENAPKKARSGKIKKATEKRIKNKKANTGEILPHNIKYFKNRGLMRYDYLLGENLNSPYLTDIVKTIMAQHKGLYSARLVIEWVELDKKGNTRLSGSSSELFLIGDALDFIQEYSEELNDKYEIPDITEYYLWVYIPD